MGKRRSHYQLRDISQLDVTPLVDLTFILLIVFMITAPALEQATDVSPPVKGGEEIDPKKSLLININQDGNYKINNNILPKDGLKNKLDELFSNDPKLELHIRADKSRPYGEVMEVMRVAQNAGFEKVSLITEAE